MVLVVVLFNKLHFDGLFLGRDLVAGENEEQELLTLLVRNSGFLGRAGDLRRRRPVGE